MDSFHCIKGKAAVQIEINRVCGSVVWFSKDLCLTLVLSWNFNSSMPCWKSSWTEEDKEPSDEPPWHHRTDVTRAAEKELLSLSYLPGLFVILTWSLFHTYLISLPYLAPYLHQDTNQKTCNCKTKLTGRRHDFLCLNANIQTPTADLFPPDILPMGIWSIHHRIHIM